MKPAASPYVPGLLCVLLPTVHAAALEADKRKAPRKEVFEFTAKPRVTREGDKVTGSFAVKDSTAKETK